MFLAELGLLFQLLGIDEMLAPMAFHLSEAGEGLETVFPVTLVGHSTPGMML
jgi:hypothetical protein